MFDFFVLVYWPWLNTAPCSPGQVIAQHNKTAYYCHVGEMQWMELLIKEQTGAIVGSSLSDLSDIISLKEGVKYHTHGNARRTAS